MSFAKKMKRAKARPEAKKAAVAERNMAKRFAADAYQEKADYIEAEQAIMARCRITTAYCLWLMRKLFKLTRKQILEVNDRACTIAWCLKHSYDKLGRVTDKGMITHEEIYAQLKEECNFDFQAYPKEGCTKKVYYVRDHLDGALLAFLFAMRTACGFGRIRLTRMMEQVREMSKNVTYEQYVDMVKWCMDKTKILAGHNFTEKVVPPEMFGEWIYKEATA